ncbi:MAG: divalent cation tolerance protein CutA [Allobranchiibius sp.]
MTHIASRTPMMSKDDDVTSQFVQVQITVVDEEQALRIAEALVAEGLAAGIQQLAPTTSIYRTAPGEVSHRREVLLFAATTSAAFEVLADRVRDLHSEPAPSIVAIPLVAIDPAYAEWLRQSVRVTPTSHLEIERKFSLEDEQQPPDPADWPAVSVVSGERRFHLVATYFDTDDVTLARQGITVRRRLGGTDAGWHLKLPRGEDAREEIWLPLDSVQDDGTLPQLFRDHLATVIADRAVHPVCRVDTRRTEWDLSGGGVHLATTCDDLVTARNFIDPEQDRSWHEMEVELVHGGIAFLDGVTDHLAARGVRQATIASKLRSTLGTLMERGAS